MSEGDTAQDTHRIQSDAYARYPDPERMAILSGYRGYRKLFRGQAWPRRDSVHNQ